MPTRVQPQHAARAIAVAPFLILALLLATSASGAGIASAFATTSSATPRKLAAADHTAPSPCSSSSSGKPVFGCPHVVAPPAPTKKTPPSAPPPHTTPSTAPPALTYSPQSTPPPPPDTPPSVTPLPSSVTTGVYGTYFTTQVSNNTRCIDIPFNISTNGISLEQFDCREDDDAQIFDMVYADDNWYSITQGGRSWDITGASTDDGAILQMWTTGNPSPTNQQFGFFPAPGGGYVIKARHSMKCVDVRLGNTGNGAALWQWDCIGSDDAQIFTPTNVQDYSPFIYLPNLLPYGFGP